MDMCVGGHTFPLKTNIVEVFVFVRATATLRRFENIGLFGPLFCRQLPSLRLRSIYGHGWMTHNIKRIHEETKSV